MRDALAAFAPDERGLTVPEGLALVLQHPDVLADDPFSQQKMRYHAKSRTVIYRSKMHPVLKRNFEVFPLLDWLAALTAHIPNSGEHVVRYSGWYSNLSRGKRKKTQAEASEAAVTAMGEVPPLPRSRRPSSAGGPTSSNRSMRPTPCGVPSAAGRCGSSPSLTTLRSSRRS